jgi:hypothetical protein
MMLDEKQLEQLLRLKRFEQPPPGYFERALSEFHRRQREELLRRSAFQIWFERVTSSLGMLRVPAYAYGAAFGLFLVTATFIGSGVFNQPPSAPFVAESLERATPAGLALNRDVDWSDFETQKTGNSLFPTLQGGASSLPRYILDGRPVSYEASSSF